MRKWMLVLVGAALVVGPLSLVRGAEETTNLSGEWTGTAVNSEGVLSPNILKIREHREGKVTGEWGPPGGGLVIEKGERITPELLQWETQAEKGHYRVRCIQKGRSLVLEWTFTYHVGEEIKGFSGTTVLIRK